ncbi:MAG: CHAD domain-containing protein [Elusimicrobiota bacterium]|nr:CHAD domain-containing protein [Elusimicrobiota bacterium]
MAKAFKIPDFKPDLPLNLCIGKILKVRFSELYLFKENCIYDNESNVEALHNMRVATRRLQMILKLFNKFFQKNKFRVYYKRIKKIIKLSGCIREQDVLKKCLDDYKKNIPDEDKKVIDVVIARQMKIRVHGYRKLVRYLKELDRKNFRDKFLRFIGKI